MYAASVIRAQLDFPAAEIDAVLAELGPISESDNGIELYDFFLVRDTLRSRHGIQAAATGYTIHATSDDEDGDDIDADDFEDEDDDTDDEEATDDE